jgi:tRNA A37 threonylcarbamoyladenosine synthetase subunit TsaC/SUA5/YrdC
VGRYYKFRKKERGEEKRRHVNAEEVEVAMRVPPHPSRVKLYSQAGRQCTLD